MENNEVEFVVTLPNDKDNLITYKSDARTTLGVLFQIISQAENEIIISVPFLSTMPLFEQNSIGILLSYAFERGVKVSLGTTSSGIDEVLNQEVFQNNKNLIRLYQATENLRNDKLLGTHAKFYLADNETCYLGSANFTYLGINKHIEMGVLIRGPLVKNIFKFWNLLISEGYYTEIKF